MYALAGSCFIQSTETPTQKLQISVEEFRMENDIGNMAKYKHSIAMITVSTRDTLSQKNKGTSV